MSRYVFTFRHMTRLVEFGPHEDEEAAKTGFQIVYGYWPEDAVATRRYMFQGVPS